MSLLEGIYRKFQTLKAGKGPLDLRQTGLESIAVDQVALPNMEMARAGRRFWLGYTAAPTGIAPVQALATTAAQWVLWNDDPFRTYWLDELGVFVTSGTPGVGGSLYACIFRLPSQTGGTQATGLAPQSNSNGGLSSKAVIKSAITITGPAAPNWKLIAENPSPNVGAFPGSGTIVRRNIGGAIAVPPGMGLGLYVLALAGTTPLFAPMAEWVEAEADME